MLRRLSKRTRFLVLSFPLVISFLVLSVSAVSVGGQITVVEKVSFDDFLNNTLFLYDPPPFPDPHYRWPNNDTCISNVGRVLGDHDNEKTFPGEVLFELVGEGSSKELVGEGSFKEWVGEGSPNEVGKGSSKARGASPIEGNSGSYSSGTVVDPSNYLCPSIHGCDFADEETISIGNLGELEKGFSQLEIFGQDDSQNVDSQNRMNMDLKNNKQEKEQ